MKTNKLSIDFKIITPEKVVCQEEIYQITLPVMDGLVTILPGHRSYIAALKPGEVIFKKQKNGQTEESLAIAGGFVEFHKNRLIVLVDEAERAEEIDIKKAEEARQRAEDLKNKIIQGEDGDYAQVAATLERELSKIKIAKKYLRR
jgi:F-type H+-transporting ATPase subunit epsilon